MNLWGTKVLQKWEKMGGKSALIFFESIKKFFSGCQRRLFPVKSFWGPVLLHFKKSNEILETWLPSSWNPDKIFAPTGLLGQVRIVKKKIGFPSNLWFQKFKVVVFPSNFWKTTIIQQFFDLLQMLFFGIFLNFSGWNCFGDEVKTFITYYGQNSGDFKNAKKISQIVLLTFT